MGVKAMKPFKKTQISSSVPKNFFQAEFVVWIKKSAVDWVRLMSASQSGVSTESMPDWLQKDLGVTRFRIGVDELGMPLKQGGTQ